MYLLYLDDSGSPGNKNEEYFVLGGICIPETSINWLSNKLDQIASSIDLQDSKNVEFHAAEIFRGKKKPWDKFPNKMDRIEIIKNVLHTIKSSFPETVIFACAIHKKSYSDENPVLLAYEDLASRFNMYLQNIYDSSNSKQYGLIIIDRSSYEAGLQSLAVDLRKGGTRWGLQLRNIIEIPFFVDSLASRLTQLADHIAYAVFRRYESNDLSYFNYIEDRFYKKNNVIHGLSHKQKINPTCTCPACITRR